MNHTRYRLLSLMLVFALLLGFANIAMAKSVITEVANDDGTCTRTIIDYNEDGEETGFKSVWVYDKETGEDISYIQIWPDGSKDEEYYNESEHIFIHTLAEGYKEIYIYTIQDGKVLGGEHFDEFGNLTGYSKNFEGGGYEDWDLNFDRSEKLTTYNKDEGKKEVYISADGIKEITEIEEIHFDHSIWRNTKTYNEKGELIGELTHDDEGKITSHWDTNPDGSKNVYTTAEDGSKITTTTYPDGVVIKTITSYQKNYRTIVDDYGNLRVVKDDSSETVDDKGNVVGEEKTLDDGSHVIWSIDRYGNKYEKLYPSLMNDRKFTITETKTNGDTRERKYENRNILSDTRTYTDGTNYIELFDNHSKITSSTTTRSDGYEETIKWNEIGNKVSKTIVEPTGYKETTTWDDIGNSKTVDDDNNTIAETKILPDGSRYEMKVHKAGDKHEWNYGTDGQLKSYSFTTPEGDKIVDLYESGKRVTTITTGIDGNVTTTTWDEKGNGKTVDSDGKLVGEFIVNEDGSTNEWMEDDDGNRNEWIHDKDGNFISGIHTFTNDTNGYVTTTHYDSDNNIVSEKRVSPFGYTETTTYDDKGNSETVNNDDKVIATKTMLEDGGYEEWYIRDDGSESLTVYDKNENELRGVETNADGVKTYIEYLGKVRIPIGPNSYRIYTNTKTFDENGNQIGERRFDENGNRVVFWYIDDKGARHDFVTAEDGSSIRTITNTDGTVEIRITRYKDNGYVIEDAEGKVVESYTKTVDEKTGELYGVTKDGDGRIIGETFRYEKAGINKWWYLDGDGKKWENIYDYDEKVLYENVYDTAGNLVIERAYDLNGKLISEKKYEVQKVEKVKYVWYPSNTTSTHGFAFRELRPELTEKWYRFTPLDLSREGEYSIPLIGGGKYIIGKVNVNVEGDEVTITYSMPGQQYDTARIESEYLNLLPDLASLTTVEPDELGEGFAFGEPISIENDLEGDTKVLLFVRNVVTFRDHYTYQKPLSRYWPNSSNYAEYYAYLESIMD